MKVGRKPPEEKTLLVKTGQNKKGDEHKYDLYMIAPEIIAKLKWDGKLSWYTEDGMRFQGAQSAIDYISRERTRSGKELTPGKYTVDYASVEEQEDRILIKTKDGGTVIIHSGKEL